MRSKIVTYMRVAISIGLLTLLLFIMRGKYGIIIDELKRTYLIVFAAAFLMYSLNIALTTVRLQTLLRGENITFPFPKLLELTCMGFFFNNFMPTSIGGDIIKAYYVGKITHRRAGSYVSVFMDRFTGLFSFAGIGLIALLASWRTVEETAAKTAVLMFVLACIFAAVISLNAKAAKIVTNILSKIRAKNIGEKLLDIYNMLHNYKNKKNILVKTVCMSAVSQIFYFITIYFLFKAVRLDISFKYILLIMPVVSVISLLPSLGGLGIREGAIVAFFGPLVGAEKAFGVSVLLLAILFMMSLIGGIIYIISPQFRNEDIKKESLV